MWIVCQTQYIEHSGSYNRMNINTLAKLTFFGLVYICTARLIDTLFQGTFRIVEITDHATTALPEPSRSDTSMFTRIPARFLLGNRQIIRWDKGE